MAAPGQAVATSLAGFAQAKLEQKIGYLLTIAVVIAVALGAWMWSSAPDYRALSTTVDPREADEILKVLQQANIPYRLEGESLLVPAPKISEARMKLAARDLGRGRAGAAAPKFTPWALDPESLMNVKLQRELETHLARSIEGFAPVSSARVHLAVVKPQAFVRDQKQSSASVFVTPFPGRALDTQHISAIVHLVSTSVPDLPPKNVSVSDPSGILREPGEKTLPGLDPQQIKRIADLEAGYVRDIERILLPIVGAGNVRAQVRAELDFSEVELVQEIHKPNQKPEDAALISQQTSEATSTSGAGAAGGVPGALSNQPPVPAQAPLTTPNAPQTGASAQAGGAPVSVRRDSTANYAVDKSYQHTRKPTGQIRKVSTTVVVNYRAEKAADGKQELKPLTDKDREIITKAVQGVIAFNSERGDTFNLIDSPFVVAEAGPAAEETPFWKSPENITLGKEIARQLLIAGIALYVIFGVLRPMLQAFTPPPPPSEPEAQALPAPVDEGGDSVILTPLDGFDNNRQSAREIARKDPKRVANVMKQWVNPDGR